LLPPEGGRRGQNGRLIADAHNDLALELVLRRDEPNPFGRHWLPHLKAGGVSLQVCPLFVADRPADRARDAALAQAAELHRALRENAADVFLVRNRADLDRIGADGRIGLALSMEGVEALERDPGSFDELWELGVRMVGLTWNFPNAFAGGLDSPEQGLTDLGRELVDRLGELGGVLDLAHASPPTFAEAVERGRHVLVSHAGCRAVHDHPRNLSDDQLRALAGRGGVLGAMALALVVGAPATIERLVDHVDHAVEVMGIDHVALGADFVDQLDAVERAAGKEQTKALVEARRVGGGRLGLRDLEGPQDYPRLVEALERRGYGGERLDAILSGNLLRVLREALPTA
jgi:membrane dipeptidase